MNLAVDTLEKDDNEDDTSAAHDGVVTKTDCCS